MERVTIIVNESPGSVKAWNAIRLAAALRGEGLDVYVFLMHDGTYAAVKGQEPVEGLRELNLADKLGELLELGAQVACCSLCANARGLKQEHLIEGVFIASMVDLAKSIKQSRHVITF